MDIKHSSSIPPSPQVPTNPCDSHRDISYTKLQVSERMPKKVVPLLNSSGPPAALRTPPPSTDGSWTSALELRQVALKPLPPSPSREATARETTGVAQAAGVKRDRGEAAADLFQYDWYSSADQPSPSSSDDESCDSLFSSGSSFAEPEDSSLVSLTWDPGSPCLGRLRARTLRPAYMWFSSWRATAHYTTPQDDRLPPRKRARISSGRHSQPSPYVKTEDVDSADMVVVSKPLGFFHLACPFYVSDPDLHLSCVEQHDFGSVQAVRQHLRRHHQLPPYCGNCRRIFARATDRDRHHSLGSCKSQKWIKVDGLDDRQKNKLRRPDKPYLGETAQWGRVWDVVFPKSTTRPSPYLRSGLGLTLSMLRDFWAGNGRDIIVQLLDDDAELRQYSKDERVVSCLVPAALEDLVAMVMDLHKTGNEVMS